MLVLGIDTATLVCSVGLAHRGKVVGEYTLNIKKTHSQRLLPLISQMLEAAGFHTREIQGIAVASGPGSFTGIRIGIATAKGLAQALEVPLVGISTLDILAAQFIHTDYLVCPILDARRQQVYTAFYRNSDHLPRRVSEYMALSLDSLAEILHPYPQKGFLFPGDALGIYEEILREKLQERFLTLPEPYRLNRGSLAAYLGHLRLAAGAASELYSLTPLYVRKPEAEVKWEEKQRKVGSTREDDERPPAGG
jgi:tRNA threonylcarbamoyladenosine biosynthesis protein TsaB